MQETVLKEGWLQKRGKEVSGPLKIGVYNWQKRYCVLVLLTDPTEEVTKAEIRYYAKCKLTSRGTVYTDQRGDIPLDPAYDDLEVEREYGSAEFQVVCRRQLGSKFKTSIQNSAVETHTYHFKAESSAIAAEWTQLIKGVAWEDLAEKAKAKKEKEKKKMKKKKKKKKRRVKKEEEDDEPPLPQRPDHRKKHSVRLVNHYRERREARASEQGNPGLGKPPPGIRSASMLRMSKDGYPITVDQSAPSQSQVGEKLPRPPAGIRSASMLQMSAGGVPKSNAMLNYHLQQQQQQQQQRQKTSLGGRTASMIHKDISTGYSSRDFDAGLAPPPPSVSSTYQDSMMRNVSQHKLKVRPPPGVRSASMMQQDFHALGNFSEMGYEVNATGQRLNRPPPGIRSASQINMSNGGVPTQEAAQVYNRSTSKLPAPPAGVRSASMMQADFNAARNASPKSVPLPGAAGTGVSISNASELLQRARQFKESGIINEQEYLRMREGILTGDEEITGALSSFLKEWDHEFE